MSTRRSSERGERAFFPLPPGPLFPFPLPRVFFVLNPYSTLTQQINSSYGASYNFLSIGP